MALGAAPRASVTALTEMHRAALEDRDRVVVVAEQDGEVVAMAHISRAAPRMRRTAPRCNGSPWRQASVAPALDAP
jgi:hypothetical protein